MQLHAGIAALLLLASLAAGCLDPRPEPEGAGGRASWLLQAGPDQRAFDASQGREFDLVADRDDASHLSLAFVMPRANTASPSWLAFAKSRDGGATWHVEPLCGDPLLPPPDIDCPFLGARLASDPVLTQLADGTLLYVGVALRPHEVTLFAARFPRDALRPDLVTVVARSTVDVLPGAHTVVPAPYQVYYNGKPNVMQAQDGRIHLVLAAGLVPDNDAGPDLTTSIPYWLTSADGGATWSTPARLSVQSPLDVGSLYAVGVEAFQTLDGALHAIWWDGYSNALHQVTSRDGVSFSPPRRIADVMGRPSDARVDSDNLTRPWTAVDRSGGPLHGSVYVLADDKSGGGRDLVLYASRDDAATWQRMPGLGLPAANGQDETMGRLLLEPSGALAILYPSWRPVERWTPSTVHLARSTDGGATFQSVQLSSGPNPHPNPGDYNDLAVTRDGILALWEDARGGAPGERWAWRATVQVREGA